MKKGKFTLVQQEEKLNEILSILINKARNQEIDKISSKAESLTTQSIVRVSLEIPGSFYNIGERYANRIKLIKIIKESTSLDLKDAKDFADLVKESVILQYQEVIKLRNALKEYGIKVCIIQQ